MKKKKQLTKRGDEKKGRQRAIPADRLDQPIGYIDVAKMPLNPVASPVS